MEEVTCKLTVFFEDPFWVGIYERTFKGNLEAAKVIYGSEPKDYEVYDHFLRNFSNLRFSSKVIHTENKIKKINPKRMQKIIKSQILNSGAGTKAQEALKLQHEQNKIEHKAMRRENTEEEKQRQFELRQKQKKEKHRGR
ncbi:MAG: YjdF family protein [Solirubrobacterales bacterium]